MRRFWLIIPFSSGLSLLLCGFIYAAFFASIPYQQPTPKMAARDRDGWKLNFGNSYTGEDFQEWESACREIEAFALRVAVQVRDSLLDKDSAIRQISERFPRLSRDRVGRTYSQAMYFSMHE